MTDKSRDLKASYDRIAYIYDFWDIIPERLFYRSWRAHLWSGVKAGRILEIGVGTGKNIPFYPSGAKVTAIDISSKMLGKAVKRAAARQDVFIELFVMDVNKLSFDNKTFDTVIGSFILTVLPDPRQALQEIMRVSKVSGTLLLLEFVRSDNKLIALIQDLLTPFTHTVYKAYINRDITTLVKRSGFQIISVNTIGSSIVKIISAVLPGSK